MFTNCFIFSLHRVQTKYPASACTEPITRPVSCCGKKSLGNDDVEVDAQRRGADGDSSVSGWWRSTQPSVRLIELEGQSKTASLKR